MIGFCFIKYINKTLSPYSNITPSLKRLVKRFQTLAQALNKPMKERPFNNMKVSFIAPTQTRPFFFPFFRLGCWIWDPGSRRTTSSRERRPLEAISWKTNRTLCIFLHSYLPRSRSSKNKGISIIASAIYKRLKYQQS